MSRCIVAKLFSVFLGVSLFVCGVKSAQAEVANVRSDALSSESSGTLAKLEAIANKAMVRNGEKFVGKYDRGAFDEKQIIAQWKVSDSDDHEGCSFSYKKDATEHAIKQIENEFINDQKTAAALKKMHRKGLFMTSLAREWNGKRGDSEACDITEFVFFTEDGYMLQLEYSFAD